MSRLLEGRTVLILLLLGFELYVVVAGFGYGRHSRIFPVGIGIPTVVLTALALVATWKPGFLRRADVHLGGPSFGRIQAPIAEETEQISYPAVRVLRMVGWLCLAALGLLLVGFRVFVPIYIVLFARLEGHAKWVTCILVAVFSWAFIIGYFDLFMEMRMFRGVLFGDTLPLF